MIHDKFLLVELRFDYYAKCSVLTSQLSVNASNNIKTLNIKFFNINNIITVLF